MRGTYNQLRDDFTATFPAENLDDGAAIEVPAAIAVAVDRQQHLRLDLGEAIDDAGGAEIRRGA